MKLAPDLGFFILMVFLIHSVSFAAAEKSQRIVSFPEIINWKSQTSVEF